tara:strand:+ start:587 stop:715 length:129 start_codon:yes stop_codon:yes gene_type:complete
MHIGHVGAGSASSSSAAGATRLLIFGMAVEKGKRGKCIGRQN